MVVAAGHVAWVRLVVVASFVVITGEGGHRQLASKWIEVDVKQGLKKRQ